MEEKQIKWNNNDKIVVKDDYKINCLKKKIIYLYMYITHTLKVHFRILFQFTAVHMTINWSWSRIGGFWVWGGRETRPERGMSSWRGPSPTLDLSEPGTPAPEVKGVDEWRRSGRYSGESLSYWGPCRRWGGFMEFAVAVIEPGCDKSMNESFCSRKWQLGCEAMLWRW